MLQYISWIFGIHIDWMVGARGHGKCKVDAITGKDKYDLSNAMIRGMDAATRGEFFNKLSGAMRAREYLTEYRQKRVRDTKHKDLPPGRKVHSRRYEVAEYTIDKPISCEHSAWVIKTSEWKKGDPNKDGVNAKTKNGLHEMFQCVLEPVM